MKTLINILTNLYKMIDAGKAKSTKVNLEMWDTFFERQKL